MNKFLIILILFLTKFTFGQSVADVLQFHPEKLNDTIVEQVVLNFFENGQERTELHRFYSEGVPEQIIFKSKGNIDSIRVFTTYCLITESYGVGEKDTTILFGSGYSETRKRRVNKQLRNGQDIAELYKNELDNSKILHSYRYYENKPYVGIIFLGAKNMHLNSEDSVETDTYNSFSTNLYRETYFVRNEKCPSWQLKKIIGYEYSDLTELNKVTTLFHRDTMIFKSSLQIKRGLDKISGSGKIEMKPGELGELRMFNYSGMFYNARSKNGSFQILFKPETEIVKSFTYSKGLSNKWESIELSGFINNNWTTAVLKYGTRLITIARSF